MLAKTRSRQNSVVDEEDDSQLNHRSSIAQEVRNWLDKNSLLTAKPLCNLAGLPWPEYRDYVNHLRAKWKADYKSRLGLKCLRFHGARGFVYVDGVDRAGAVGCVWVGTRARNGMLVWRDLLGRMEWFGTGRVNLWVRRPASRGRAVQLFCNGFTKTGLVKGIGDLERLVDSLRFKGATAVLDVGERLPYVVIDLFKQSNGVRIKLGDDSHPTGVEVEYCYPDWAERSERRIEELTGVLRRLLGPEGAVDPAGVVGRRGLGDYVS